MFYFADYAFIAFCHWLLRLRWAFRRRCCWYAFDISSLLLRHFRCHAAASLRLSLILFSPFIDDIYSLPLRFADIHYAAIFFISIISPFSFSSIRLMRHCPCCCRRQLLPHLLFHCRISFSMPHWYFAIDYFHDAFDRRYAIFSIITFFISLRFEPLLIYADAFRLLPFATPCHCLMLYLLPAFFIIIFFAAIFTFHAIYYALIFARCFHISPFHRHWFRADATLYFFASTLAADYFARAADAFAALPLCLPASLFDYDAIFATPRCCRLFDCRRRPLRLFAAIDAIIIYYWCRAATPHLHFSPPILRHWCRHARWWCFLLFFQMLPPACATLPLIFNIAADADCLAFTFASIAAGSFMLRWSGCLRYFRRHIRWFVSAVFSCQSLPPILILRHYFRLLSLMLMRYADYAFRWCWLFHDIFAISSSICYAIIFFLRFSLYFSLIIFAITLIIADAAAAYFATISPDYFRHYADDYRVSLPRFRHIFAAAFFFSRWCRLAALIISAATDTPMIRFSRQLSDAFAAFIFRDDIFFRCFAAAAFLPCRDDAAPAVAVDYFRAISPLIFWLRQITPSFLCLLMTLDYFHAAAFRRWWCLRFDFSSPPCRHILWCRRFSIRAISAADWDFTTPMLIFFADITKKVAMVCYFLWYCCCHDITPYALFILPPYYWFSCATRRYYVITPRSSRRWAATFDAFRHYMPTPLRFSLRRLRFIRLILILMPRHAARAMLA